MEIVVKVALFLGIIAISGLIQPSAGHAKGAPGSACDSMVPGHRAPAQNSQPPYQVIVPKYSVQGGEALRIRLAAPSVPYKGFFAIPTKVAYGDETEGPALVGKIEPVKGDRQVQTVKCFGLEASALTHTDPTPKKSIEFDWIAPNENARYVILTSFVKDYDTFWVKVPSPEIQVTKNPFFPKDDEEGNKELNPDRYGNVQRELQEKYYEGCGRTKGCFGVPDNCFLAKDRICEMFTSWRYGKGGDFKFQIAGKLPDWENYEQANKLTQGHVSSGLSHDNKMGSDSVIGCVYKDGRVVPKSYFNVKNTRQNSIFQNESTGLGKDGFGKYVDGFIMCDFTRTPVLYDTTKEMGVDFDLNKDKLHIMMARASSLSQNADNKREKLGYHATPEDRAVSYQPIFLTEGYTPSEDNRGPNEGDYYPPTLPPTLKPTSPTKKHGSEGGRRPNAGNGMNGPGILAILLLVTGMMTMFP